LQLSQTIIIRKRCEWFLKTIADQNLEKIKAEQSILFPD
jgi:hypothetical protein